MSGNRLSIFLKKKLSIFLSWALEFLLVCLVKLGVSVLFTGKVYLRASDLAVIVMDSKNNLNDDIAKVEVKIDEDCVYKSVCKPSKKSGTPEAEISEACGLMESKKNYDNKESLKDSSKLSEKKVCKSSENLEIPKTIGLKELGENVNNKKLLPESLKFIESEFWDWFKSKMLNTKHLSKVVIWLDNTAEKYDLEDSKVLVKLFFYLPFIAYMVFSFFSWPYYISEVNWWALFFMLLPCLVMTGWVAIIFSFLDGRCFPGVFLWWCFSWFMEEWYIKLFFFCLMMGWLLAYGYKKAKV